MKTWIKALLCISLSLMCTFTCVGYAAVSGSLTIHGSAEATPPEALFITSVSGGNYIDPDTLAYSATIVTSTLTLRQGNNGTYGAAFSIEVFNNTDESYYYHSMVRATYTTDGGDVVAYSNDDIVLEVDASTLKKGDEVKAGEKKTFTVNARFKDGVNASTASKELFSIINYYFSTTQPDPDDTGGGEAAVSGVVARLPEILNDPVEYKILTDALTANTTHPDYIGNVVSTISSWDDDTEAIQNLFGVALELNIDGTDTPVTVIIQRKNVDNDESTGDTYQHVEKIGNWVYRNEERKGVEVIMYMTPVNPKTVSSGTYIETYAVVYTKDANGTEWYQTGEMYKGTARVVGYVSGLAIANDSISPSTWRQYGTNKTIEQIVSEIK